MAFAPPRDAPTAVPLRAAQRALRETTERLAQALASPTVQAPSWSPFEWRVACAAAALHGIAPLLHARLRWAAPPVFRQFLANQHEHTRRRQARFARLLDTLDARARARGVAFLALKGSALHRLGLYREGERPMADLDLLARSTELAPLGELLEQLSYQKTAATWKHAVYEPSGSPLVATFGEEARNALKIDLHSQVREILPRRSLEIGPLLFPSRPAPGLNDYASPAALMLHLLLHAAGAIVFRYVRLIQLHDLALLAARFATRDWEELLELGARCGGLWWAHAPLELTARYYGGMPAQVRRAAQACAPPALLRSCRALDLTTASYSDLRRQVLPGMAWTRSLEERLAYTGRRALLAAATFGRILGTGRAALAAGNSTYRETRSRAVPLLGLRPVRPAGLNAVRAALALPE